MFLGGGAVLIAGLVPALHDESAARLKSGTQQKAPPERGFGIVGPACADQIVRCTIFFLISAMALAGFRPLGQVCAQFMIVWQR